MTNMHSIPAQKGENVQWWIRRSDKGGVPVMRGSVSNKFFFGPSFLGVI